MRQRHGNLTSVALNIGNLPDGVGAASATHRTHKTRNHRQAGTGQLVCY